MHNTNAHAAIDVYAQVDAHGNAAYANPHRLIQMLLDNTLKNLAAAKGRMLQGRVAEKCEHISRAMALVEGLRLGLDKQAGGDIAHNLEDLYDYIERQLLQANIKNNPAILDEISSLLNEIKTGWDAISNHPAANPVSASGYSSNVDAPVIG